MTSRIARAIHEMYRPSQDTQDPKFADAIENEIVQVRKKCKNQESAFYFEKSDPSDPKVIARVIVTFQSSIFVPALPNEIGGFKEMRVGIRVPNNGSENHQVAVLSSKPGTGSVRFADERETKMLQFLKGFVPELIEKVELWKSLSLREPPISVWIEAFYPLGNLKRFTVKEHRLDPDRIAYIAYNALKILKLMHESGYVHRDVKPDNFLLTSEQGDVRICDLGFAYRKEDGDQSPISGTPMYLSPESARSLLKSNRTSNEPPSDIWAAGISILELSGNQVLLKQYVPRHAKDCNEFCETISKVLFHPILPESVSHIDRFAAKLLHPDWQERPTAHQSLQDRSLRKALMQSEPFMEAVTKEKVPLSEAYEDLLGFSVEGLCEEHLSKVEDLHHESVCAVFQAQTQCYF